MQSSDSIYYLFESVREIEEGHRGHGPPNILAMPRLESSGKVVTRAYTLPRSLDFKMRGCRQGFEANSKSNANSRGSIFDN